MSDKNEFEPFPFLEIGGLYTIVEPKRKLRNLNYCVWLYPKGKKHIQLLPESSTILYVGNAKFLTSCGQQGELLFNNFSMSIGIKNHLVKIETTVVEDGA